MPEASPVVVPVPAPLRVNVVPLPAADGLTVPEIVKVGPEFKAGSISTMLKLYRSVVGAVSLIVTEVPDTGVEAF